MSVPKSTEEAFKEREVDAFIFFKVLILILIFLGRQFFRFSTTSFQIVCAVLLVLFFGLLVGTTLGTVIVGGRLTLTLFISSVVL